MNITYLFGAGASAEAMPTVEEIPKRLKKFTEFLQKYQFPQKEGPITTSDLPIKPDPVISEIVENLKWLKESTENSTSIDTFAKRLFVQNSIDEYSNLKKLLTVFFLYESFKNNERNIDKRYDNFFASIIKKDIINLPVIKILSWNYDLQFEMAFNLYSKQNKVEQDQILLQVYPSQDVRQVDDNKFAIMKLNGCALQKYSPLNRDIVYNFPFNKISSNELIKIIKDEFKKKELLVPLLFFSWDDEMGKKELDPIKVASDVCASTEILVVVGYTFPYFNRSVDRKIIQSMNKLNKIYFQGPEKDIKNYYLRFRSIRPDIELTQTENNTNIEQFYLPPEME